MGDTMALSEHERRQLERIEEALHSDDPRLAEAMRARHPSVHYPRRIAETSLGLLIGACGVLAGSLLLNAPLGIAGFVVLLFSSAAAISCYRHMAGMVVTDWRPGRRRWRRRRPAAR
jgi:Protein of unknown function (DUF3040)